MDSVSLQKTIRSLPVLVYRQGLFGFIFTLPLIMALLLLQVTANNYPVVTGKSWLKPVYVSSIDEIESLFRKLDYDWPVLLEAKVPRVLIQSLPAEFNNGLSISRKKALFIRVLLPSVLAENQHIRQQRAWLKGIFATGLSITNDLMRQQLQQLADDYNFKGDLNQGAQQQKLLQRIDEVPVALVLAQAANESGWGTSRFVQQANNLFGHWTYKKNQGLVPLQRDDDKSHRLRIFVDLRSSVQAYMKNLNTGKAYSLLRQLRAIRRDNGQPLIGEELAVGLVQYSQRGEAYVEEIRSLIRINQLERFERVQLRPGSWRLAWK